MPVQKDESGKRSIAVEIEVPGSPEEVWAAIATGPGISSWFLSTALEEEEGGNLVTTLGPGVDVTQTITEWSPPHRFIAGYDGLGPGAPPLASEWTVEAKSGGTCLVRVVHSLFASDDDWDDQLESIETGWPHFFQILRLYLSKFRGQAATGLTAQGVAEGSEEEAWDTVTRALGVAGAAEGDHNETPVDGAPPFAGVVEYTGEPNKIYLWLDEPERGIGSLSVYSYKENVHVTVHMHLFGKEAAHVVARDEPLWRAWMADVFREPTPAEIY